MTRFIIERLLIELTSDNCTTVIIVLESDQQNSADLFFNSFTYFLLTHFSQYTLERVIGKQCRSRSDAAECTGTPVSAKGLALGISKLHSLTHLKLSSYIILSEGSLFI